MSIANPPPHGCGGGAYMDVFTACLQWTCPLRALTVCTSRERTPQLQDHSLIVHGI
jgi:hypothetical protein